MYRGLHEGMDRARLAARGKTGVLRVGSIAVNLHDFRELFDGFAKDHPECEVQLRHVDFGDPFGQLRAGDIDVQIVWLPVKEPDLTVGPVICTEPIVLAVGATTGWPAVSRSPTRTWRTRRSWAGPGRTTGGRSWCPYAHPADG